MSLAAGERGQVEGGRGQVGFGVRRDVEGGRKVKDPRLKAYLPPQASRLPPNEASGMQYDDDKYDQA